AGGGAGAGGGGGVAPPDDGAADTGAGDDIITLDDFVDTVDGGAGADQLLLNASIGEVDIAVDDTEVTIIDRFTGEEMVAENFETIEFTDESYTAAELEQYYGADVEDPLLIEAADQDYVMTVNDADPSISVVWDRVVQQALIDTSTEVGPTISARAFAMVHTAMYDAWSSYDDTAVRVSLDQEGDNVRVTGTEEDQAKAMSYAAITVLQDLFPDQAELYEEVMVERLGFSMEDDGSVEASVGIDAAEDLLSLRAEDGSNQENGYEDTTGYEPVNPNPTEINDITRWTPENIPLDPEDPVVEQTFLTPHWQTVEGFTVDQGADGTADSSSTIPDPAAFFSDAYAGSVLNFDEQTITLDNAVTVNGVDYQAGDVIDVSQDLIGTVINQAFIDQANEIIDVSANLTDEEKV
ncbi:DUF6851 domain-containing protein, partial [Roseibium sp. RKSG952]|uniref:DUF6851 domain-containing protein n=1 Tax=Roseibium sp. RKSG952 TaxID=2529384 RepID=UPI0034CEB65F